VNNSYKAVVMELLGRTAIVTGAGGGLGRCHAIALAAAGAKVAVNDISAASADRVAAEIRDLGGEAFGVAASVTDETQVAEMVDQVKATWGRADILVNNAGILIDRSFAKMDLASFRRVMEVHLMGAVICTKAVWAIMREQRHGRVVMTTSSSGLYGNFGQANYAAAKMALVGLMQTLALEGERYNVHVNCLAPTAATQMTSDVLSPDVLDRFAAEFVSPGLVALVSDHAPTRMILCAGGGHFAQANITLTEGIYLGQSPDAADRVAASWELIGNRSKEVVPAYGFMQAERELLGSGLDVPATIVRSVPTPIEAGVFPGTEEGEVMRTG
jgi:NAD(P)-dependent dehydrogenase (short-subunit alcohol dehydrogenase family)